MTADPYPAGLYDGQGQPVGGSPVYAGPSLLDPAGPRQECVGIWPLGMEWNHAPALIWLAPLGPFDAMPEVVLGTLVAAVDAGASVILWGSNAKRMAEAGQHIGSMTGGSRA